MVIGHKYWTTTILGSQMNLHQYIHDSERTYNYRIKTVCELNDDAMDRLERVLMKHCPVDIKRPRKTMLQKNPLDFTTVDAAEVYIVDIELGVPASVYTLTKELCKSMGINGDHLVVRGYNDPHEIENELQSSKTEMDEEAEAAGMEQSSILLDPNYENGEDPQELAGDAYNKKFLSYLRKVQDEKPTQKKVDAPHPLSVWKDQPKGEPTDEGDYNANIEGAPTIGKAGEGPDVETSNQGNLTDRKRTYKRQYGKEGTLKMLQRTVDTQKDPK